MAFRKAILLCLGTLGTYFFARGGIEPLLDTTRNPWEYLLAPITNSTPFDAGVALITIVLFTWVYLFSEGKQTIPRTTVLRAVALASALLAAGIIWLNVSLAATGSPAVTATLSFVAVLHAVVGVGAALLLLCRRESRGAAAVPLFATLTMTVSTGALFVAPLFS